MARIKPVSFSPTFKQLYLEALNNKEHNDCTVKAVAILCDVPYAAAHAALQQEGRKNRTGSFDHQYLAAIRSFGFTVKEWTAYDQLNLIQSYPGVHKKLSCITTHHPRRFREAWAPHRGKRLLMKVSRHVAAFKDGELHDWTVNKARRVIRIWEVTKVDPEQVAKVTDVVQSFWAHK